MGKTLQEVHRMTTAESVIKSLESFIISNSLKPGMSIPSEHELAGRLGVSRNILREGLQYFKTLGIIETRPKTGAYIKRLCPKNPFEGYMPFMHHNKKMIKDIGQLRMIIERGMIPLLFNAVTPEDIEELERIASVMREVSDSKRKELEYEFHGYMLKIIGNELLDGIKPLLLEFFDSESRYREPDSSLDSERMAAAHLRIVEALKKKDEKELQRIITAHYEAYQNIF